MSRAGKLEFGQARRDCGSLSTALLPTYLIISDRPCLRMAALELGPYPSPSTMPAASATMFFSVPHISAPGWLGEESQSKGEASCQFFC